MRDPAERVRAVTWNVHGCVGTDGRHDVERTGEIIRALVPDIAAFQEVDLRRQSTAQPDTQTYLRAIVGDHGHVAWALTGYDGQYGQMLASRFPLTDCHVHDISSPGREPRKIMEATATLSTGPLRVIATHLGLRPFERRRQFARLREIILSEPDMPLLLMGDFNDWRDVGVRRHLSALFNAGTRHRSFPSRFPTFALDRILCRGEASITESRAAREARAASDHLPVVADIVMPGTA